MRLLLLLILTSGSMLVYAQENTATTEEEKVAISKPGDNSEKQEQGKVETPDTFNPTEKLSEDIPVDFPVDI